MLDYKCCVKAAQLNQTSLIHIRALYSNIRQNKGNRDIYKAAEIFSSRSMYDKKQNKRQNESTRARCNGQVHTKLLEK